MYSFSGQKLSLDLSVRTFDTWAYQRILVGKRRTIGVARNYRSMSIKSFEIMRVGVQECYRNCSDPRSSLLSSPMRVPR